MTDQNSDSDFSDICEVPPDIPQTETKVMNRLLPEKSKRTYERAYVSFMEWRRSKNTTSFSEELLLSYFDDLAKKFRATSLWSFYSMLKSMLIIKHDVDIAKYPRINIFLKRKLEGYEAKKSKTFKPEEINKFLNEAPDKKYLLHKVGLIFGIMGACRREDLYKIKFSDVQVFETTILVTIHNTKTDRIFTVRDSYFKLCKKYIDLRPKGCTEPGFFLQYSDEKCSGQKIGINKFGALGKTIANYLNLPNPEMYTGQCFRRTSATLLLDTPTSINKHHADWLSATFVEGYKEDSMESEVQVSNETLNSIQIKEDYDFSMPGNSSNLEQDATHAQPGYTHFSNCTIHNVHNYKSTTGVVGENRPICKVHVSNKTLNSIWIKEEVEDINMASSSSNLEQDSSTVQSGYVHFSNCTIENVYNYSN